jgi:predicted type IV restriction endonuclease
VEWAILTNGRRWQVYHISNTTPIEEVLLIDIDLLADNTTRERIEALAPLSRESLGRDVLTAHWNSVKSLKAENLWKAINTPKVLAAIRAELRKDTDQLVDANKLASAIQLLKP